MAETLLTQTPLFLAGAFILGLLIGSFLNVVILRLPARMQFEWRCQCLELLGDEREGCEEAPPGIVRGRSRCPHCQHAIRAHENIPIVSWLFLRGRCSACQAPISLRYPLVELATGLAFLTVAWQLGPSVQALSALLLTGYLVALTGIDLDHQLLPDNMTLPLLWAGLLTSLFHVFTDPVSAMIGAMAGYLFLWSIYHGFRLLTGKEGMGFGDFKLLAAMGAWLGWQALPLVVLISSLVGAVVGVALLVLHRHERDQPMPFGPFIAIAGWITLLWGRDLLDFYIRFSGLG